MSLGMRDPNYEFIRILMIEDDRHTRTIIRRLLLSIGFKLIEEAEDGNEGFRELLRTKPSLILCDIHMEPVDGITFLRKLRGLSNKEFAGLPVIFLTSNQTQDAVLTAKNLRVDGYLVKPVSLSSLKDRIDFVMRDRLG